MSKTRCQTLVRRARTKMKKNLTEAKEHNVMNVKGLVTLKLNIPLSKEREKEIVNPLD